MNWLIQSLLSAVTRAGSQTARKQATSYASSVHLTFMMRLLSLPIVLVFILFFSDFVFPNQLSFWLALLTAGFVESVATVASIASLKRASISQVAPLQAFIPVFLLPLSLIFFKDLPPFTGVIGVLLIVLGSYVLNLNGRTLTQPFKTLFTEPAAWLMLLYAFLSAFVFIIEKWLLLDSNPASVLLMMYLLQIVFLFPVFLYKRKSPKSVSQYYGLLVLIACLTGFSQLIQFYAVEQTFASYAFAVQRLDVILIILMGWFILGEEKKWRQFAAAVLAVAGLGLVALS